MAKFCKKCGKKIDDDAVFCDNCGTKVASESLVASTISTIR